MCKKKLKSEKTYAFSLSNIFKNSNYIVAISAFILV